MLTLEYKKALNAMKMQAEASNRMLKAKIKGERTQDELNEVRTTMELHKRECSKILTILMGCDDDLTIETLDEARLYFELNR